MSHQTPSPAPVFPPAITDAPDFIHQATAAPVFEALITPHCSLTRRGRIGILCGIMGLSLIIAARFWLMGAWPVLLCSLIELPLLAVLMALNVRRGRANEMILLDANAITVVRTDPAGRRRSFSLPTAWLRVDLHAERGSSRVMISHRGTKREIGAFLHETEKQSLFESLRTAVYHVHHPQFDNPQLRT